MLPKLVISRSQKAREKYIKQLLQENDIPAYNIFTVKPDKGNITIDSVRALSQLFLTVAPGMRLIILESFELAGDEVQNSLLKMLEEKTGNTQFIIFTDHPEGILPTIRSRAQTVTLEKQPQSGKKDVITADSLPVFTMGSFAFLNMDAALVKTKEEAFEKIDELTVHFESLLRKYPAGPYPQILRKIMGTRGEIQNTNVNPQFAYDNLLLFVSELVSMK